MIVPLKKNLSKPWRSTRALSPLSTGFGDLIDSFWGDLAESSEAQLTQFIPRMDVNEEDSKFIVTAELPGLDEEDIEIHLSDGILTLKGEKKHEEEHSSEGFKSVERSFGSFRRSVQFPTEIEESEIKAKFKKGVLKIKLPKSKAAKSKTTQIQIEKD